MATPPRPPSRIDGKINPAYTAWRREYILKPAAAAVAAVVEAKPEGDLKEVAIAYGKIGDISHSLLAGPAGTDETTLTMDVGETVPDPDKEPEIITLRCIKQAINKRYVYCDLKGVKVPVKVKKGIGHKLVKKSIKVSVDRSGETPIYTHIR